MSNATSIKLAKADTALIRQTLNYNTDRYTRVFSESRKYGRRVKFWWGCAPGALTEVTAKLREAFGDRFIDCYYYNRNFEVQLKPFA